MQSTKNMGRIVCGTLALLGCLAASSALAEEQPAAPYRRADAAALAPLAITKTYSAAINADGTTAFAPAGTTSANLGTGNYEVVFPSNVSQCVYTASVGTSTANYPSPGIIVVTPRAGNVNGVFLRSTNLTGAQINQAFHLHVQC